MNAALCAAILGLSAAAAPAPAPALLIDGGTLIDVRSGAAIPGRAILVQGDRIVQVGPRESLQVPDEARVIDARGKWILPGLIDTHVHLTGSDLLPLELFLANGVTTVRDPGGSVLVMRMTAEALSSGKRTGPRLFFCGDILDGMPPGHREATLLVDTPERARSAAGFLADQGVHCLKVYNNVKEPELEAIVRAARERGLPVIGHVPRTLTMTRAVELGLQGLEHIRITGREMLPPEEADRIDFLPPLVRETLLWQRFELQSAPMAKLIAFLARSDVFLAPTLAGDEWDSSLSWEERIGNPDNRYLPPALLETWKSSAMPKGPPLPPEARQRAIAGFEKRKQFVAICRRAGVRIVAGTDGAYPGTLLPGFGLQRELELLVQAGLSPLEAIQAATLVAAHALGKEHDLGAVEPGRFADLLIVGADPLLDIRGARRIEAVIKGGVPYGPRDLLKSRESGVLD